MLKMEILREGQVWREKDFPAEANSIPLLLPLSSWQELWLYIVCL